MNPKLGKGLYYASIIITIIALIAVMVIFRKDIYEEEFVYSARYLGAYFSFAVVLSLGVTLRELFVLEFNKKKIIIKMVIIGISLIVGILLLIFNLVNAKSGLVILFVSIFVLAYCLIPTIKTTNKG